MVKKLQSLAKSKAIIIDKNILKLLGNPIEFNLNLENNKIILTPIIIGKPKTKKINKKDFYCNYFEEPWENCKHKCTSNCADCTHFVVKQSL